MDSGVRPRSRWRRRMASLALAIAAAHVPAADGMAHESQPQAVARFAPVPQRCTLIERRLQETRGFGHRSATPHGRSVCHGTARYLASRIADSGTRGILVASRERGAAPRWWSVWGGVFEFGGAPIVGADAVMVVSQGSDPVWWGTAQTDASGAFLFSGSPTGTAAISVALPQSSAASAYHAWGIPLQQDSQWLIGLYPGLAPFSTTRTSSKGWDTWRTVYVETYGSEGGADTELGEVGLAHVMPPDYGYACVYYYDNQGVEWNQSTPWSYAVNSGGVRERDHFGGPGRRSVGLGALALGVWQARDEDTFRAGRLAAWVRC